MINYQKNFLLILWQRKKYTNQYLICNLNRNCYDKTYVTEIAEWLDTMSTLQSGGFRSQHEESSGSNHIEKLW